MDSSDIANKARASNQVELFIARYARAAEAGLSKKNWRYRYVSFFAGLSFQ